MGLFQDFAGLVLKGSVGSMMQNDGDDVVRVKDALHQTGYRAKPAQNGIIDQDTDDAIRTFQREKGLKVDGYLMPGGETEKSINATLNNMDVVDSPIIKMRKDREKSLVENTNALFEIRSNPKNAQNDLWDDVRTFDVLGKSAVQKYNEEILESAQKHNLDPDVIRAVMYAENARGHKLGMNALADVVGLSDSVMPMNIQIKKWSKLIEKNPKELYNSKNNIEASAVLLKRIKDRIKNPTPEKIGSIWNSAGKEETSEFGEYIGKLYREKPWKKTK